MLNYQRVNGSSVSTQPPAQQNPDHSFRGFHGSSSQLPCSAASWCHGAMAQWCIAPESIRWEKTIWNKELARSMQDPWSHMNSMICHYSKILSKIKEFLFKRLHAKSVLKFDLPWKRLHNATDSTHLAALEQHPIATELDHRCHICIASLSTPLQIGPNMSEPRFVLAGEWSLVSRQWLLGSRLL